MMGVARMDVGGLMAPVAGPTCGARRGFSLLEVLLAVVILALGLLGVAAVLPVVVTAQRDASEATLGVSAINSAKAYLRSRPDLIRVTNGEYVQPGNQPVIIGFGVWTENTNWSRPPMGLWETLQGSELDPVTGEMIFDRVGGLRTSIRVGDRLWPGEASGAAPQLVWDFVGRRMAVGETDPAVVQIAMFVRRVDQNIRVPQGRTLREVLTGQVPQNQRRVPVGVQSSTSRPQPTLDGTGDYAVPILMNVRYDDLEPDGFFLDGGTALEKALAAQVGQRLVDNLGNVYLVRGTDSRFAPPGTYRVLVDPPVPSGVRSTNAGNFVLGRMVQVVFTPQIPASVSVFNVTVADPVTTPTGSGAGRTTP